MQQNLRQWIFHQRVHCYTVLSFLLELFRLLVWIFTQEAIASFVEGGKLPLSYLYYALPKFVIENASTNIYGARILNQELIGGTFLLAPSYKEAEKIANFLDHETTKIDTLIEKQQQLIKLLIEKRQAVISHASDQRFKSQRPHARLRC